jgi:hypothetical protein
VPHSRETDKGKYVEDEMNLFLDWFSTMRWIRTSLGRDGRAVGAFLRYSNDAEPLEKESLEESLEESLKRIAPCAARDMSA